MLEVKKINVFYGDAQALWDISFAVSKGEIVTLVGSNGAGKSTTLKAISGLVPPSSGEISLEGTRIDRDARPPHRGDGHRPDPGRPAAVAGPQRVGENLELGAYTKAARAVRAETDGMGPRLFPRLEERARTSWREPFPGGEQQMLAIGQGAPFQPQAADPGRAFAGSGARSWWRRCLKPFRRSTARE